MSKQDKENKINNLSKVVKEVKSERRDLLRMKNGIQSSPPPTTESKGKKK